MHRFLSTLASMLAALLAGAFTTARAAAPPSEGLDTLYGIRLGVPLSGQLPACPSGPDGQPDRLDQQVCWTQPRELSDGLVWQGLRLPRQLFAEVGLLELRGVRVQNNRVVEIEIEGMAADLPRLTRSLRQRKGTPTSSESYERHGRVFGLGKVQLHTWRDERYTLHFDERASSDKPRLRAVVNDWIQ